MHRKFNCNLLSKVSCIVERVLFVFVYQRLEGSHFDSAWDLCLKLTMLSLHHPKDFSENIHTKPDFFSLSSNNFTNVGDFAIL